MNARCSAAAAAVLVVLGGACDLIDKATAERPNSAQSRAIGDTLSQAGTIATIADDPGSTSEGDLLDTMTFDHYVAFVNPDVAASAPAALALPLPPPDCIVDDGQGRVEVTDCDVTLPGGRACKVDGFVNVTKTATSTRAVGELTLSPGDESCPTFTWNDIDITLDGPPTEPSSFTGACDFSVLGDGHDYTGTLSLEGIAFADGCDKPSVGSMTVTLMGTYNGQPVTGGLTATFHNDPCGDIRLE